MVSTACRMNSQFEKYTEYLRNVGRPVHVAEFDMDWEPIGPLVRAEMEQEKIILCKDGIILVNKRKL